MTRERRPGFVRTTFTGGVIFLLPIMLVVLIIYHATRLAAKLAEPVMAAFPAVLGGRVAMADAVVATIMVGFAFAAGLYARTGAGQGLMRWFENSLIGALPQFNFVRGIAESLGDADASVEVVLVPTDAGLCLGFIFEPGDGPWAAVFIPGAPEWTSGSLAFAERSAIRPAGISFSQAVRTLKRLGAGPQQVTTNLAAGDATIDA